MKLRAPEGCSGFTLEGRPVEIMPDLSIDVPDRFVEHCKAHGFRAWDDGIDTIAIENMTHAQLMAEVRKRTEETLRAMSMEELRARLLAMETSVKGLLPETEGAGANIDPAAVTAESIEKMNRLELFAFLKAKGVAVGLPIKNDELRRYARMALPEAPARAEMPDEPSAPLMEPPAQAADEPAPEAAATDPAAEA